MNIAVVGSRNFTNYDLLKQKLDSIINDRKFDNITIISGGASGADTLAEKYAKENNYGLIVKNAEWNKYGKSAGYKRNVEIVNLSNLVVAFWDGKSRGTNNTINIAKGKGIEVIIHNFCL
jgi:hypothetical protein